MWCIESGEPQTPALLFWLENPISPGILPLFIGLIIRPPLQRRSVTIKSKQRPKCAATAIAIETMIGGGTTAEAAADTEEAEVEDTEEVEGVAAAAIMVVVQRVPRK